MSTNHEKTAQQEKRKRKIILLNIFSGLIIVAAITWGIITFFHLDGSLYTNDAQVDAYINPVNTRVPGYIKEIRFSEHQHVKKGDTLLVIDNSEYKIQVQQANAALADAVAGKTVVHSGVAVAQNSERISGANIEELKARLANMETNYKRYENLLKEDVVTQFQFDQVKTELDATRAKYQALVAQEQSSQLTTEETALKLGVSEAGIQRAQAALDMAKLNLSYTVITAPYDGVVGRRMIEEGQLLQAGQTVVTIVRGGDKWVTANYTEAQIARLREGQQVSIRIDAIKDRTFYGKLVALSDATGSKYSAIPVDNSTGNFVKVQQRIPVKIEFTESNKPEDIALLKAGMNVEVKVLK
ncbi:MAG: HlyD family secretion protein [Chitinophagaceae bacterium]